MPTNKTDEEWNAYYQKLKSFYKENAHTFVSHVEEPYLATWTRNQRNMMSSNTLGFARVEQLKKINFVDDYKQAQWDANLTLNVRNKGKTGQEKSKIHYFMNSHGSRAISDIRGWLSNQLNSKTLSEDKHAKLKEAGFDPEYPPKSSCKRKDVESKKDDDSNKKAKVNNANEEESLEEASCVIYVAYGYNECMTTVKKAFDGQEQKSLQELLKHVNLFKGNSSDETDNLLSQKNLHSALLEYNSEIFQNLSKTSPLDILLEELNNKIESRNTSFTPNR